MLQQFIQHNILSLQKYTEDPPKLVLKHLFPQILQILVFIIIYYNINITFSLKKN